MVGKALLIIAVALVSGLLLALAGDSPISYARDIEPIILKECADCHNADNPKKGLDLTQGKGHANMLNIKSKEVDMPLLKASDPAGSYLWLKLTHKATEGKGMPATIFGAKKLPAEKLALVQKWIIDGANP